MKLKNNLKTVRFTTNEQARIGQYLKGHPYIKSFSTLVRAALWEFLQEVPARPRPIRPSFLWDYDLNHGQIMEILHGPQKNRLWLVAKILEHARWNEIWEYLTLPQIEKDLPRLRLPEKTRAHWVYALHRWRHSAHA